MPADRRSIWAPLHRFFVWLGIRFADPGDEEAFADYYARRDYRIPQAFIAVGAISFVSFYTWDEIIDPVHQWTAVMIRLFFAAPLMLACSAALFWKPLRRHVEWVSLAAYTVVQVAQVWIYTVLDHGFDYAVMGFVLIYLALTSAFPIRMRFVLIAAAIAYAAAVGGYFVAGNARPGWLLIIHLAIISAIMFGVISAFFREHAARVQFVTDRTLVETRERADELLTSILPANIVSRIQAGETGIADSLGEVSMVFADLAGFTSLSRRLSPPDLIRLLDDMFSRFDRAAEAHGMEKIKTIGDAYMAVGGMKADGSGDHAANAARFALAIQAEVRGLIAETGYPMNIRIGLHVGPVIAGVIGVSRPSFDCWGDTVALASGLEARAVPGTILISESAYARLRHRFAVGPMRRLEIKDIGRARVRQLIGPLANEDAAEDAAKTG